MESSSWYGEGQVKANLMKLQCSGGLIIRRRQDKGGLGKGFLVSTHMRHDFHMQNEPSDTTI